MEGSSSQIPQLQVKQMLVVLRSRLENIVSPPTNPDINEEDLYNLSFLKFGKPVVDDFTRLLDTIPFVWSDKVKLSLLKNEWKGSETVAELLDWIGPWYKPKDVPSEECLYLGPPTGICFKCCNELAIHNPPSNIRYAASSGAILKKKKITLRCNGHECKTNYRFEMYGTRTEGYRFYENPRDAVVAVDTVYIDKKVFALQWSFSQHAWVSSQGFAESWHEAYQHSKDEAIDRRTWIKSFWWGELEEELHRLKAAGIIEDVGYRFFKKDESMDKCMSYIESIRSRMNYTHAEEDCSPDCKLRGCGKLWATDGLWKIRFAHCMFIVKNQVGDVPLLNYPNVCTNEPLPGKAFCSFHCQYLQQEAPEIPLALRNFLNYEAADNDASNELDHDLEANESSVDNDGDEDNSAMATDSSDEDVCNDLPTTGKHYDKATSPLSEQTGQVFLKEHVPCVEHVLQGSVGEQSRCSKDLGQRTTLRRLSRGMQVVVRAGGHIDSWTTLYVSESNGQVLLFIITWLYETLQSIPSDEWHKVILCYDNMCQLVKMRVSRNLLKLPKPYDEMWMKITKVIDTLHVRNHVMDMCKTDLHPDKIGQIHPDLADSKNTQAAEQTFVYLGRHWRITNSMSKTHNLFYIHRVCIRRNEYIAKCNKTGKRPLLPSRKKKSTDS